MEHLVFIGGEINGWLDLFKQGLHGKLKFVTQIKKIKRQQENREGAVVSIFGMRLLTTFLIVILGFNCFVRSQFPEAKLVGHICNGDKYDKSGPFADSLYYVLVSLSNETPKQAGYDYHINDALAYGHATCSSNVAYSECDACVRLARAYLMTTCDGSVGGQVLFVQCSMRYEQYSFS
ncbi:antifungal protein ginkbilobin-like protein [Lycium barbarum]|uniref:antifungal protein ginkbilobin-like protein n=1 Tax=Lycium barbarum TaxID=112863 RepID=UPI00293E869F|nr:antifungal protein ginkbilobin-like protein [Lycium barbarum]